MVSSDQRVDFVVFGATGVTGKRVCEYLASGRPGKFSWAVAGRNEKALKKVLADIAKLDDCSIEGVNVIISDVNNYNSVVDMARQAKVLLNIVGPYRFYGETVVRACIDAKTHYVDVSGEPFFLEQMESKYHEVAQASQVTIVGSAGFDSVPADVGALFTMQQFPIQGVCTQIESFVSIKPGKPGMVGHATTWECAIHGMGQADALVRFRRGLNLPKIKYPGPQLRIKGGAFFDQRVKRWSAPFPGADASVVRRSQRVFNSLGFPPVQYAAYFTTSSRLWMMIIGVVGKLVSTLSQFSFMRKLFIRFPSFFSMGLFTHDGPTEEQMHTCAFEMRFFGAGYKDRSSLIKNSTEPLDTRVETLVSGPEPGYVATPIYSVELATLLLNNTAGAVPFGVLTPSVAVRNNLPLYLEKLRKQGCTFSLINKN